MSKPIRVSSCAYIHTEDIDLDKAAQSKEWDKLANVCVLKATTALKRNPSVFTRAQSDHVGDVFEALQVTQRTIRRVLEPGKEDPTSVDALALARLQLEALYTICLFTEEPGWIDVYVQDYWRKRYVLYLLGREELKNLPRGKKSPGEAWEAIEGLRHVFGITREQQLTVEHEELGTPLSPGVVPDPIPSFPTPGRAIRKIPPSTKRRILERLYPEYVHLCSFAHGLPMANLYKNLFNDRSRHRSGMSDADIQRKFDTEVMGLCYIVSNLSIAQATAELIPFYPADMELRVASTNIWNAMTSTNLLGKALWNIRTKDLLGALV
jgi:hypothetical protein